MGQRQLCWLERQHGDILPAFLCGKARGKELTTPDAYPLTLNSLLLACNQLSNRDPVVAFDEALVVWSGGLGLLNLTIALLVARFPPNLWVGLSAGITLLALLDGSQHFTYLRHCQVDRGMVAVLLGVFVRIGGLSLATGVGLGLLVANLPPALAHTSGAGLLTMVPVGADRPEVCALAGDQALYGSWVRTLVLSRQQIRSKKHSPPHRRQNGDG